jgi:hypothetical protein
MRNISVTCLKMSDRFGGLVHIQPEKLNDKSYNQKNIYLNLWGTSAIRRLLTQYGCSATSALEQNIQKFSV